MEAVSGEPGLIRQHTNNVANAKADARGDAVNPVKVIVTLLVFAPILPGCATLGGGRIGLDFVDDVNPLGAKAPVTTSFQDAVTEIPLLDDVAPTEKDFRPLEAMPQEESSQQGCQTIRRRRGVGTSPWLDTFPGCRATSGEPSAPLTVAGNERGGNSYSPRAVRALLGCAPADLREALVGAFERVQVGGVVQVERRLRERHDPPARWRAPRPREQLRVAGGVREPDGL
jgi:hypothetical protein